MNPNFSNAQIMARGGLITDVTTEKKYALGQRIEQPNGNVYEYVETLVNKAIAIGDVLIFNTQIAADPDAIVDAQDETDVTAAGYVTMVSTPVVSAVAREISLTSDATETADVTIIYTDENGEKQTATKSLPDTTTVTTGLWATKVQSVYSDGAFVGEVDIGWKASYSNGVQPLTTTLAAVGCRCGVAEVAVAAIASTKQYMFALVCTGADRFTGVKVLASAPAATILQSTGTAGALDDPNTLPIWGITLGIVQPAVAGINYTASVNFPVIGENALVA